MFCKNNCECVNRSKDKWGKKKKKAVVPRLGFTGGT